MTAIQATNLSKAYGFYRIFEDLSFEIGIGECFALFGPNGAGKTTTMRIITGYMPPTKGTVHIEGVDIFDNPLQAKQLIGYLPENPPLYTDMTVSEYLDFVADIKQVSRKEKKSRIFYVIEKCGLSDVRKRIISHLSKGFRQRVGIAQALVNNPSVLILDEPTIGLDPLQIIEIRDLIKSLSGERTVILSTHILPEVTMICSKVIIINEGKMVLEESLDNLAVSLRDSRDLLLRVSGDGDGIKEKIMSVKGVSAVRTATAGEFVITHYEGMEIRDEIVKLVVDNDLVLLELRPLVNTLEEIFMKAISSEGN